jgi:hypothetical protein
MSLTAGNLFISSYNNQDYDTSTDFAITLAVPVTKATRVRLLGGTIANLFMPFGQNDKLWSFSITTLALVTTTYTMNFDTTIRWATIGDFLTYVNGTLFTTASPSSVPAVLSYNASKNQLVLTGTLAGSKITMPGWNWNNQLGNTVAFNSNYRLGWTSINPVVATSPLTTLFPILYADGFPNVFNRTNVVYVTTNVCTDSNNDANIGNVLGRIPMTSGWGSLVNYENVHSDFSSPIFTPNIKEIRIRLLDEDYQLLTNPGNAYFNLVMGIEY